MNPLTIISLLNATIGFLGQVPELVTAVETAIGLVKSGDSPTPEQQATIDAGLKAAHEALQAS